MNLRLSRLVALCAAASIAACTGTTEPTSAPTLAATRVIDVNDCAGPATSASVPLIGNFGRTIDDDWADIARTTPGGFGGVFYATPSGTPTILLTDTTQAAAARAALVPILAGIAPTFDVMHADVRPARWDAAQLLDWYHYLEAQPIWVGSNVTSTDINEVANRIRINTADSTSQDTFVSRLATLDLPCRLVVVGIMPPAIALSAR